MDDQSESEWDAETSMNELNNQFIQHLTKVDKSISETVPANFLKSVIASLVKLYSQGANNVLYLLSEAILQSSNELESFGAQSLPFKVLELMLVSLVDTEENQRRLLNSSDQILGWILDGLEDHGEKFVNHVNNFIFPRKNLEYKYTTALEDSSNQKVLRVVRTSDMSVQCQYQTLSDVLTLEEVEEEDAELNYGLVDEEDDEGVDAAKDDDKVESTHDDIIESAHVDDDDDDIVAHVIEPEDIVAHVSEPEESTEPKIKLEADTSTQKKRGKSKNQRLKKCTVKLEKLDEYFTVEGKESKKLVSVKAEDVELDSNLQDSNDSFVDETGKRKTKCHVCSKYVRNLSDHLVVHNKTQKHFCPICNETFMYRSQKKKHIDRMHPDATKEELTGNGPNNNKECNICGKSFATFHVMQRHKRQVHMVQRFYEKSHTKEDGKVVKDMEFQENTCGICGWLCKSKEELDRHKETKICLSCGKCNATFATRTDLLEHKTDSHTDGLHNCGLCGWTSDNARKLRRHFRENQCLACLMCSELFSSKDDLTAHRDRHARQLSVGKCQVCSKSFFSEYFLSCHMKDVHKMNPDGSVYDSEKQEIFTPIKSELEPTEPVDCVFCEETFPSEKDLDKHKKKKHWKEVSVGHLCSECGGRFRCKQDLADHMNTHTGSKPYTCDGCGLSHHTRAALRACRWRHLNTKTTLCDVCGEEFHSRMTLTRHKKTMHSLLNHKCQYCNLVFKMRTSLIQHIRSNHTREKKFNCVLCGKGFTQKSHLDDHMAVHGNEKRFFCNKCGEGFVHRVSYKRHMIRHAGLKAFKCPLCEKKFDCADFLKRHAKTVHKHVRISLPNYKNPGSSLTTKKTKSRRSNPLNVVLPKDGDIVVVPVDPKEETIAMISKPPVDTSSVLGQMLTSNTMETGEEDVTVMYEQPMETVDSVIEAVETVPFIKNEAEQVDFSDISVEMDASQIGDLMFSDGLGDGSMVVIEGVAGAEKQVVYLPAGTTQIQIGDRVIDIPTSMIQSTQ